jgi:hypothetical protein
VPTPTKHYNLTKPDVGGSENEWGGLLNGDLDDIDALLGGDKPIIGINIEAGQNAEGNETQIDGGAITGEIGGTDPDNPVTIHPDTEISGKVKSLVGMDSPDGTITNVDVTARRLEMEGEIVEETQNNGSNTDITLIPESGTIQSARIVENKTHLYDLALVESGMSMTLILDKVTSENTVVVWKHNGQENTVKWVGGGAPDLNTGINIIQFFTHDFGMGPVCFGAYTGVAS